MHFFKLERETTRGYYSTNTKTQWKKREKKRKMKKVERD